ncbi:MAG: AI-2E family transporter [Bacillota bacterium]
MAARPISVAQVLTGTAAALAMLYFFRPVLVPFVVAFVLAVLVSGLVRWIRARSPRAPGWVVSISAGIVVIVAASAGIFVMAQGMVQMVSQGPALVSRIDQLVGDAGQALHLKEPLHLSSVIGNVSVPEIAGAVLSSVQGLLSGVLLMIVYFGFMLAGRERMSRKMDHIGGPPGSGRTIRSVIEHIASDIETYIWVQTITGLMLTAASAAVMLAVGLHNVLFWSVVFFLLTFIPNIGVTVGSIVPALFALLQFPTVWQAIVIFVLIQIVATVIGNFIYPRLQAETQNIDPVVTILALAFWSLLWGLAGAFLAVPLTLMAMMVFSQFERTKWLAALLSNDGRLDPVRIRRPKD